MFDLSADDYSSDEEFVNILDDKSDRILPQDLQNKSTLSDKVLVNIEHNPEEPLLINLKYAFNNAVAEQGIVDMSKILNLVCGSNVLPDTHYKLDKIIKEYSDLKYTLHAACPVCMIYLGRFDDSHKNGVTFCTNCSKEENCLNPSSPCYFAMIDPAEYIRDISQTNEIYYNSIMNLRTLNGNNITDIYDGDEYQKFLSDLSEEDRHAYATVIFNTDGAPVFESTTVSIWPLYLMVNEIPIRERLKNLFYLWSLVRPDKARYDGFSKRVC